MLRNKHNEHYMHLTTYKSPVSWLGSLRTLEEIERTHSTSVLNDAMNRLSEAPQELLDSIGASRGYRGAVPQK